MTRRRKRIMIVREFRADFQRLTEPVQVLRSRSSAGGDVEILGTWTPAKGREYPADEPDTGPERSGD